MLWSRRFCITLALVIPTIAQAQSYPEFRGPGGQGVLGDAKLPVTWGTGQNVAWKKAIPGKAWSSPILWEGKLYLTTAVAGEGKTGGFSLRALCLDAKSGNTVWDKEIFVQPADAPKIHGKNSHASPTPITDGKKIFVHFGHQGTAALSFDGKILWKQTDLKYAPVHGNGGSPVLVGNKLIYSADGGNKQFIVALDTDDGKVVWKTDRPNNPGRKFAFGTPLVIDVAGKKQVVSQAAGRILAYDPEDGKEIWQVRTDGYSVVPRPVFGNGMVYVCTGYDQPSLFAIRPDGQGDVTESHIAWKVGKNVPHNPSPVLVGSELYLISDRGIATCLDAKTGKEHWQERIGGNFSSALFYAGGNIYFQAEDGVGTVVKAGTKFQEVSRNDLAERAQASYAAGDGALFIRLEKHLYRIQEQ